MGYERHNAIIVSGMEVHCDRARDRAINEGCAVSELVESPVNGIVSFLVAPDGSKEGWADSDAGDAQRAAFIKWLDAQRYEDGSSPLDWAEVQYGDDERDTRVIAHSDETKRSRLHRRQTP